MGKIQRKEKENPKYKDEKGREFFFDNAKFLLILLVVLAHSIAPMKPDHDSAKAIWTLINSFHMSCFIFMTGYFAKSFIKKDGEINVQRLFTYIMYYLFAQGGVMLFKLFVLGDKDVGLTLLVPMPALWYLMCMIFWYSLIPFIVKFKPVAVVVCAFILGLLIGYDTKAGGVLSVCRAITHLPFFMLGYYFKKEWIFKYRNKWTQIISVLFIAGYFIFVYFNYDHIATRMLECSYNYYSAKLKYFTAFPVMWVNRLLFYVNAVLLCSSFLMLVPRTKTFFTRFGSRTLQVYIIHRLIYFLETDFKWFKLPFFDTYGIPKMLIIAAAVTFILSLKPFEYPFKLIAKIKIDPLLKSTPKVSNKKVTTGQ